MNMRKLTLSIPKNILSDAKRYSRRTRQPLSRLVSRYFAVLSQPRTRTGHQITSRVKRVTGIAKSHKTDEQLLLDALAAKYR